MTSSRLVEHLWVSPAYTDNEPVRLVFSVIRESASKTTIMMFLDDEMCLSTELNSVFVPFGGGKLGVNFEGSISEFKVRKTLLG